MKLKLYQRILMFFGWWYPEHTICLCGHIYAEHLSECMGVGTNRQDKCSCIFFMKEKEIS